MTLLTQCSQTSTGFLTTATSRLVHQISRQKSWNLHSRQSPLLWSPVKRALHHCIWCRWSAMKTHSMKLSNCSWVNLKATGCLIVLALRWSPPCYSFGQLIISEGYLMSDSVCVRVRKWRARCLFFPAHSLMWLCWNVLGTLTHSHPSAWCSTWWP